MFQSAKILRALVATVGLSVSAGCVQEQASAPQQAAAAPQVTPAPRAAPAPQPAAATRSELATYQVYFNTKSAAIHTTGKTAVKTAANVAANDGATRVTVIGKSDRVGSSSANMALSMRRANAVRNALIAAGVPAARIDTSWTGEEKQQVPTANGVAEPRDRVVDIIVTKLAG